MDASTGWSALYLVLEVLKWLVIVRALLSWVVSPRTRNPLVEGIERVTDPLLRPLRSLLPGSGGMDLSPLVAIFLIYFLQRVISGL